MASEGSATAVSTRPSHLGYLDGLRGLAALYVVLHHVWLTAFPSAGPDACALCRDAPAWTFTLMWGQLAVVIFMVVSGFSLALAPMRSGGRLAEGFRPYITRRFFRIVPPYWAALALSTLIVAAVVGSHTGTHLDVKAVVVHALLIQNVVDTAKPNAAFWSIAVEWQIYFLMPLLLLVQRRWGGIALAAGTAGLASLAYVAATSTGGIAALLGVSDASTAPVAKLLYLRPHFVALFALGMVAAQMRVRPGAMPRSTTAAALAGIAGVVFVLALTPASSAEATLFWIDLMVGTVAALVLACMARGSLGGLARGLGTNVLRWLGDSSYSLYLVHAPLLELIFYLAIVPNVASPDARFAASLLVIVPVVLVASRVFWRWIERPFVTYRSFGALRSAWKKRAVTT